MPCPRSRLTPRKSLAEETREGEQVDQSGWGARIVFWVLGGALFLSISLLPILLLAWFYTGGTVHLIVAPTVAVAVGLLRGGLALGRT